MERIRNALRRIINDPAYFREYVKRYLFMVKIWSVYVLALPFREYLNRKDIWLVGEKYTEARDNGYHFFRYIRENHPEINIYYVISKDSPDLQKVRNYGNVICVNSVKHIAYYLSAKVSANSQAFGAAPRPAEQMFHATKMLHRKDQVVVHLKHGITKDEMTHEIDYAKTHFDLLCCVSDIERKFIQDLYGYPDDSIKSIGFCRFDNLLQPHEIKKQILIMPTFRVWLEAADATSDATEKEKKVFLQSKFYKMYSEVLSDDKLISFARKYGYTLVFYPHYALQSYIHCFDSFASDVVRIADRHYFDVQQLLLESELLVTDYSSVFFDFAYMGKPMVFYQFDEDEYRNGHYKRGYFDYHRDAFGAVCRNKQEVLNEIYKIIENQCCIAPEYQERVDHFFINRDTNNCKRIFEEVYRKAKEK